MIDIEIEENQETINNYSQKPISLKEAEEILRQMKTCVCKIHIKGNKGTGFFTKIPYKEDHITAFITSNDLLGESDIKEGLNIIISWENEKFLKILKFFTKGKDILIKI